MSKSDTLFDRKFVIAAISIGAAYAGITVLSASLIGKEAAGVAGVALTALAAAIFKQFESLRFRQLAESEGHDITIVAPTVRAVPLLTSVFLFIGAQFTISAVVTLTLSLLGILKSPTDISQLSELLESEIFLAGVVVSNFAAYFISGFLCGRIANMSGYTQTILAALFSLFLNLLIPILPLIAQDKSNLRMLVSPGFYTFGTFWFAYLAITVLGVQLSRRTSPASQYSTMAILAFVASVLIPIPVIRLQAAITALLLAIFGGIVIFKSSGRLKGFGFVTVAAIITLSLSAFAFIQVKQSRKFHTKMDEIVIRNNLRQLSASAEMYFAENETETSVTYDALLKLNSLLGHLRPVAGEDYTKVAKKKGVRRRKKGSGCRLCN